MTDALMRSATAAAMTDSRPRPSIRGAGRIVVVGAALGLLGQLLFYGVGLGINLVHRGRAHARNLLADQPPR